MSCSAISCRSIQNWIITHPKTVAFGVGVIFALGALLAQFHFHGPLSCTITLGAAGLILSGVTYVLLKRWNVPKAKAAEPSQADLRIICQPLWTEVTVKKDPQEAMNLIKKNAILLKFTWANGKNILHAVIEEAEIRMIRNETPYHPNPFAEMDQWKALIQLIDELDPALKDKALKDDDTATPRMLALRSSNQRLHHLFPIK